MLLHGLTSSTAPEGLTDSSAKYNVLETNNDSHKFVPPQHKCAHTYKHTHTHMHKHWQCGAFFTVFFSLQADSGSESRGFSLATS